VDDEEPGPRFAARSWRGGGGGRPGPAEELEDREVHAEKSVRGGPPQAVVGARKRPEDEDLEEDRESSSRKAGRYVYQETRGVTEMPVPIRRVKTDIQKKKPLTAVGITVWDRVDARGARQGRV